MKFILTIKIESAFFRSLPNKVFLVAPKIATQRLYRNILHPAVRSNRCRVNRSSIWYEPNPISFDESDMKRMLYRVNAALALVTL